MTPLQHISVALRISVLRGSKFTIRQGVYGQIIEVADSQAARAPSFGSQSGGLLRAGVHRIGFAGV